MLPDAQFKPAAPFSAGMELVEETAAAPDSHTTVFTDNRLALQWDMEAIDAGTAWNDDAKPFLAKGPVGVCVRSFVRLAEQW